MARFLHVYLKTMTARFDRKGRSIDQYRDSQSFYNEFKTRTEDGWFIVEIGKRTHRFPVDGISEIVEGDDGR